MTNNTDSKVLVVGAGPSGMVAAAELARRGVAVDIVDRRPGPTELSKATILWPRAIEALADIDGTDRIRSECVLQHRMAYYEKSTLVAGIQLSGDLRPAVAPQNIVEAQLVDKLQHLGVNVQWNTTVDGLCDEGGWVSASLSDTDAVKREMRYAYVVAADGAWSTCRDAVGASFVGQTHEMTFVVADVELSGELDDRTTYYWCSPQGVVVMTQLSVGVWRVFTAVPPRTPPEAITMSLVRRLLCERVPLAVSIGEPRWVSPFQVHARQIDAMKHGRLVFVGDAAHIHSPAGGQGVNLGILDAHAVAWRLAMVMQGRAGDALLEEFADERGRAAKAAIRQANMQTALWMLPTRRGRFVRNTTLRTLTKLKFFNAWYAPWLTGHRTMYSRWATPTPGLEALIRPDRTPLLGENVGYTGTETGAGIRRDWLSTSAYTVLIRGIDTDGSLLAGVGLAEVRPVPLDSWALICGRSRASRTAECLVVSPDGYIRQRGTVRDAVSYLNQRSCSSNGVDNARGCDSTTEAVEIGTAPLDPVDISVHPSAEIIEDCVE